MDDLLRQIKLAREGAAVERCHVYPHLIRYSVGSHSLDMVTMLTLLWKEAHGGAFPRAELLIEAAFHDVAERVTGDIPSPIRKMFEDWLENTEGRVLRFLGVNFVLTDEESDWLTAADQMELVLWCHEEAARGNTTFLSWVDYYELRWAVNPLPKPFRALYEAYKKSPGRLTDDDMKEFR